MGLAKREVPSWLPTAGGRTGREVPQSRRRAGGRGAARCYRSGSIEQGDVNNKGMRRFKMCVYGMEGSGVMVFGGGAHAGGAWAKQRGTGLP